MVVKYFLQKLDSKQVSLADLFSIVKDFRIVKLKVPVLFDRIVAYSVHENKFEELEYSDCGKIKDREELVHFLVSVFMLHGQLSSKPYLDKVEDLILKNIDCFSKS